MQNVDTNFAGYVLAIGKLTKIVDRSRKMVVMKLIRNGKVQTREYKSESYSIKYRIFLALFT